MTPDSFGPFFTLRPPDCSPDLLFHTSNGKLTLDKGRSFWIDNPF